MTSKDEIDENTVQHVAELARIYLTDKEKKEFTKQLSNILNFFSEISELDTSHVKPTYHVLDIKNVFRKDEIKKSLPQEVALSNAPQKEKGYFKGPKIVH
ncbi:MAG: Asp-tRNA(Asn)/Glu-tRNA(Gln) amidotransferase subunit GatC [Promethearchaeota archaeon]